MSSFKNNLFEFATSELSQDAFICWIINWINGEKDYPLYGLAKDFLTELLGCTSYELLDGVDIIRQLKKIDILVLVRKSKKAIIIEDKTFTGEHDDQINRYKKELEILSHQRTLDITDINTVYFKTGFWYDSDRITANKTDYTVDGGRLCELLIKYKGISDIVDSFIEYLELLVSRYEKQGDINATNVSTHYIAQYNLMKSIFPDFDENKPIYSGANRGGTPWTEYSIYTGPIGELFWRIDSDKKGPYISLRFYNKHDKNSQEEHDKHVKEYDKYSGIVKSVLDNNMFCFSGEKVLPGYRGNYMEASLLSWSVKNELDSWDTYNDKVIDAVRRFTEIFLDNIGRMNC